MAALAMFHAVASPVTDTARKELDEAIAKMGAKADFVFHIEEDPALGYDGVRIEPCADGVILAGHPDRGPIYAVDVYLEKYCGVRWWAPGESYYPKLKKLPRPTKKYVYVPPFRIRETFYRSTLFDVDFKVRSKVNATSYTRYILPPHKEQFIPPEKGGNHKLVFFKARRSAYHSFFMIIPPERHFAAHPEWFSLVKGKRVGVRDNNSWSACKGQLCLTNEEMFREYVRETKRLLRESPDCDSIRLRRTTGTAIGANATSARPSMNAKAPFQGFISISRTASRPKSRRNFRKSPSIPSPISLREKRPKRCARVIMSSCASAISSAPSIDLSPTRST